MAVKLGTYLVFAGDSAWSAARIENASAYTFGSSPTIPTRDTGTPYTWHFLDLDMDYTWSLTKTRPSLNLGTGKKGVTKIVGDLATDIVTVNFNVSDLDDYILKELFAMDMATANETNISTPIKSDTGVVYSDYGVPFIFTHGEYDATWDATYGWQPKIGVGADPHAIILYKAAYTDDYTLNGGRSQELLPVTLKTVAVDGTNIVSGWHGLGNVDLTKFTSEA